MAPLRFTDSITGKAVQEVVRSDAELAEKARALANRAIDLANHYLNNGSPAVQLQVIKSIMPAIGRGMTEKGVDDDIVELRKQLAALHQVVLEGVVAS